jgi:hypothetical protein
MQRRRRAGTETIFAEDAKESKEVELFFKNAKIAKVILSKALTRSDYLT